MIPATNARSANEASGLHSRARIKQQRSAKLLLAIIALTSLLSPARGHGSYNYYYWDGFTTRYENHGYSYHYDGNACYGTSNNLLAYCSNQSITRNNDVPDVTYTSSGSAITIDPPQAIGYDWCCPVDAILYAWEGSSWNDVSSSYTSNYWIDSLNTHDRSNNAGTISLYETTALSYAGQEVTKQFKLHLRNFYNTGYYVEYYFDLTFRDQCLDNNLNGGNTDVTLLTDMFFTSEADGATSAISQNLPMLYGDEGAGCSNCDSRCPLTRSVQLWSDTAGEFITFSSGTHAWNSYYTSGSNIVFSVDYEYDLTVTGQTFEKTDYYVRVHTEDPYSTLASNPQLQTFKVTIDHQCLHDTFTLNSLPGEQQWALGDSATNIGWGYSELYSQCYSTRFYYYWNNSTAAWEDISGLAWWVTQSNSHIRIGNLDNTATSDSYRPEKYYEIKMVYDSEYSLETDGHVEEGFRLRIYDPCFDNTLSLNSDLTDQTYNIGAATASYSINENHSGETSSSKCPLTYTCEVYDEDTRSWLACTHSNYGSFVSNWDSAGTLQVNYPTATYLSDYPTEPYPDITYLVRFTVEDSRSVTEYNVITDTFQLTLSYACAYDTLSAAATNLGETVLYIDDASATSLQLLFVQSVAGCDLVYGLEFYDYYYDYWYAYTSETFVQTYSNTANLDLYASDESTYDDPYGWNITARLHVTSTHSVQTDNYYEDVFQIVIWEKCRQVTVDTTMDLDRTGLSTGTAYATPKEIDIWQLLTVYMTMTQYSSPFTDPHSLSRCSVSHELLFGNGDRTPVTASHYQFDSTSAPNQLEIQWPKDDVGLANYFDIQGYSSGVSNSDPSYLIVKSTVTYTRSGVSTVIATDEQQLWIKYSNPCIQSNGGAITPETNTAISYWIHDAKYTETLSNFLDAPTTRDGGQTYVWTNGNDLCGTKSYELLMADQVTANTDTAYVNLVMTTVPTIEVESTSPAHYTNADVQYWLKVTLDDYVYRYPEEAVYYHSVLLNMNNCQITAFSKDANRAESYSIWTPVNKYDYTAWTENTVSNPRTGSSCGYTILYSVEWFNFYETRLQITDIPMVDWRYPTYTSHSFWVQSDLDIDVNTDRQTYTIELTGTVATTDMDPPISEVWTLEITVVDSCPGDTITTTPTTNTFTDYTYYIGENTQDTDFLYNASKPKVHIDFTASWSTSVNYCPIDFEIVRDYTNQGPGLGTYEAFTGTESAVVTLIDEMTINRPDWTWQEQEAQDPLPTVYWREPQVTLRITTSDYTLDGEVWYLAVNRVSTKSLVDNDPARIYFTLTLKDVCWDLPIEPSEPAVTNIEVDLWAEPSDARGFNLAHAGWEIQNSLGWTPTTTYCGGGFTMSMIYVGRTDGLTDPVETSDMDAFFGTHESGTFDTNSHMVKFNALDWVGVHELKIRTTIGTAGNQLYSTNYVDSVATITLTVVNPCLTTTFAIPGLTDYATDPTAKQLVLAREHGGSVSFTYETPTNQAAIDYTNDLQTVEVDSDGNNVVDVYDICGPRHHYLTLSNGELIIGLQTNAQDIEASQWLEFEDYDYDPAILPKDVLPFPIPVFQIRVNSTSQSDWGSHEVHLHFEFIDYPSSTANDMYWVVQVQIEYCLPQFWNAPADFEPVQTVGYKPIYVEYIYWQYPCTYGATYTGEVVEISGQPPRSSVVPSAINMDSRSGYMAIYSNDLDDLGWYVVEVTATLDVFNHLDSLSFSHDPNQIFINDYQYESYDYVNVVPTGDQIYGTENPPPELIYEAKFNVTVGIIEVNETSITNNNTAPYLLPPPESTLRIIAGWEWEYQLGRIYDFEGDDVSVSVELRNADDIVTFDPDNLSLYIPAGVTSLQTQPVFDIKLTLTDNHEFDPLSKRYDIKLVIVKDYQDPLELILQRAEKTEVIFNYDGRVYDLTGTTVEEVKNTDLTINYYEPLNLTLASDLLQAEVPEDEEELIPTPTPVLESFTNDGVATIRFNTPMKVPEISEVEESRVALRMTTAVKTEIEEEIYKTETGLGKFEIRNAIELKVLPSKESEDPIDIDFTWEFISFTEYEAKIQLYFDIPESVSASSDDRVVVTFWAGDLFQAENGKTVRPGLTISTPISRQVSKNDYNFYKDLGEYSGIGLLAALAISLVLTMRMDADTLPIWACYDSVVLISHLPLVNIALPGGMAITLTELAKVLRLDFIPVDDWLVNDDTDTGAAGDAFSNLMLQNGYKYNSLILNLGAFICIGAILILAVAFAKLFDVTKVSLAKKDAHKVPNGRTEPRSFTMTQRTINCFLRYLQLTFTEFFICALINVKAELGQKNDFESMSNIITYFFLMIFVIYIGLVFVITAIDSDPAKDPRIPVLKPLETLYLGLDTTHRRTASNLLNISFFLRRALFAVVILLVDEYPTQQLQIMVVTSAIAALVVSYGKPHARLVSRWTILSHEILYFWVCALMFMYTPEYLYRSYEISETVGKVLIGLTGAAMLLGVLTIAYSLYWQWSYYRTRRNNILRGIELNKRKRQMQLLESQKKSLSDVQEEAESEEESYRDVRANQRAAQKRRKLEAMIAAGRQPQSQITNLEQTAKPLEDFEYDDELNELERLAGIGATVVDKLEISDDELDSEKNGAEVEPVESENRPDSVGAESSYSDFMKQWKNKLQDNEAADANGPSDVASNHSGAKSAASRRSKAASDSPFLNLSQQQTKSLLKGSSPATTGQVIPEEYEDSDSNDDGNDGVILTKTDRRRLNLLSSRQPSSTSILPTIAERPERQTNQGPELGLSTTKLQQTNVQPPAEDEDEFELL